MTRQILIFVLALLVHSNTSFAQDSSEVTICSRMFDYRVDIGSVAQQGNFIYVVSAISGMQIIDFSDIENPQLVSTSDIPPPVFDIAITGNYACLLCADTTLHIVDISNPEAPHEVGVMSGLVDEFFGDGLEWVVADGDRLYLGFYRDMWIIDISDPSHAVKVGEIPSMGYDYSFRAKGEHIFICGGERGEPSFFSISNAVDPDSIYEEGRYRLDPGYGSFTIIGDYVYFPGNTGILILDISDHSRPRRAAYYNTAGWEPGSMSLFEDGAVVGSGEKILHFLDLSDPVRPEDVGTLELPENRNGWELWFSSGHTIVTLSVENGMNFFDISDPAHPRVVSRFSRPGSVQDVCLNGNYAYLANGADGLHIVDVRDPYHPQEIGFLDTPGSATDIVGSGDFLYLADGDSGLMIIDVSRPDRPVEISRLDTLRATFLYENDNFLYLTKRWGSILNIYDISDPGQLVWVDSICSYQEITSAAVAGDRLVVTTGRFSDWGLYGGTVLVFDISDRRHHRLLGSKEFHFIFTGVDLSGELAFCSYTKEDGGRTNESGVIGVDISNPDSMHQVQQWVAPNYASVGDITIDDDRLFVAENANGLRIFDFSDSVRFHERGYYRSPGSAQGVEVVEGFAYVADNTNFSIYDCSGAMSSPSDYYILHPSSFTLFAYPNPFNGLMTFSFNLEGTATVSIGLYNITGRLVFTPVSHERFNAGEHSIVFDGNGLPAGEYLLQCEADGKTFIKPITLLK